MPNLPDLEAWAIFAQVVEHKGFTAAADALGLSKGTVSKAVSRLEVQLGASLFHRSSRTLTLTETGRRLAPRAARLLAEAVAAEEAASDEAGALTGLVRLAAPMSFGVKHVAPLVARFMAEHPQVHVELGLSDARVDLIGEGWDAALRIGLLPDSSLISRKLADVPVHLVASPLYLDRHGAPGTPAELERHCGFCYANLARPGEWRLHDATGVEVIARPRPILTTGSGDAMLPALRLGLGIAMLPNFILADDLASGAVVEILPGWSPPQVALHLVTPPGRLRPARVTALLDFLHAQLGGNQKN